MTRHPHRVAALSSYRNPAFTTVNINRFNHLAEEWFQAEPNRKRSFTKVGKIVNGSYTGHLFGINSLAHIVNRR